MAPTYSFVVTFVLLKVLGAVMPLRASESDESRGLDVAFHGEEAYPTGEGAILVTPAEGDAPVRTASSAGRRSGQQPPLAEPVLGCQSATSAPAGSAIELR